MCLYFLRVSVIFFSYYRYRYRFLKIRHMKFLQVLLAFATAFWIRIKANQSSKQCCGSGMFTPYSSFPFWIPDPGSKRFRVLDSDPDPHQRLFALKLFLSSQKNDLRCSSRTPDPDFFPSRIPVPDTESRGQKSTGSRIWIGNTGFNPESLRRN